MSVPGEVLPHAHPCDRCHFRQNASEKHILQMDGGAFWRLGQDCRDCGRIGQVHAAVDVVRELEAGKIIFGDVPAGHKTL